MRGRFLRRNPNFLSILEAVNKEFISIIHGQSTGTTQEIVEIKLSEEKKAWEIGIEVLEKVGSQVGLECASIEALQNIGHLRDNCLLSYRQTIQKTNALLK